jgi:hypothetical protein
VFTQDIVNVISKVVNRLFILVTIVVHAAVKVFMSLASYTPYLLYPRP